MTNSTADFSYLHNPSYTADKHGWCIHPLPLLTAVGNDRGGGDFHEGNTGFENVGIWTWQLISIEDNPPEDFSKIDIRFIETH